MSNSNKTVCRACLGSSSRMYDLQNTPLQGIFENLTGALLVPGDGRSAVCYLCSAQLQSCYRFQDMVRQADTEFRKFVSMDIKWSPRLPPRASRYSRSPVDCLSLPELGLPTPPASAHVPAQLEVKQEVEVKVEDFSFEDDFSMIPEDFKMATAESAPTSHQTFTEPPVIYHCTFCLKEIHSLEQLTRHEKQHETEICETCGAKYHRSKRDNHIRKHTKPFKCHICQKSFSELSSQRKHVASHSDTKAFICRVCTKGFTHKSFLLVHMRSHTGEKPYTCQLCSKTFTQIGHLISHKRTHEKNSGASYICDYCSHGYSIRSSLLKHIRTHQRGLHTCQFCSKQFVRADSLACHTRCHTGEKPFECAVCGKAYAAKANYRKHLKSHL